MTTSIWLDLLNAPISQRWYDVAGVSTRVLEAGDGPPVVLLHGAGGHAETYVRNIPVLAGEYHCYAIDMLGHGFTDAPSDITYSTAAVVDHLVRFLDTVGIERAHLVGESFGGRVSAWVAMQHPDRVASLTLNTTGGLPVNEDRQQSDAGELVSRMTKALDDPSYDNVRLRLEWLFADVSEVTDEMIELRRAVYERPEIKSSLRELFTLIFDPEDASKYVLSPERLRDVTCPTLVVWSDKNPIHSYDDAQHHLSSINDVRFELITDTGHWPHYEDAAAYNDIQLDFLRGLSARA